MSPLQKLPNNGGAPSEYSFTLLRNNLFIGQPLPTDAAAVLQTFFFEFEGAKLIELLQNVTFAVAESSWFDNMDGVQRNGVLWDLRNLEEFIGLLSVLAPPPNED